MKPRWTALLAAGLLVAACGGHKKAAPAGGQAGEPPAAVLEGVSIEPPAPTVSAVVRALPRFQTSAAAPVKLTYRWFVNGDEVPGVRGAVLPRERYHRGDRIRCFARPAAGGRRMKSAEVTVANARPRFRDKPVAPFDVPGEFLHQVFALDPDGDAVTYRLISPPARGIRLNPQTGMIRWRVAAPPAPPPRPAAQRPAREGEGTAPLPPPPQEDVVRETDPFQVAIVVEADDGHGGRTRYTVRLDLRRGRESVSVD